MIVGPDVSFYQDEPSTPQGIDFIKMKGAADFVIIRAGQNTWLDSDFKTNWNQARLAGLPRGSYWFYDSRSDPKQQARMWFDALGNDLGELPLFADFEENYGGPYKGWRKWYDFLEQLKTLVGIKEIAIYTGYSYWHDNAPNPLLEVSNLEYFHKYPLWIASYGVTTPRVPQPWKQDEWLFWQFSEVGDGKAFGVESKGIDLNYFNGDLPAFRQRFNLPNSEPALNKVQVDLNVREGPGEAITVLGVLKHSDVLAKLETSADQNWLKVRRESDQLSGWIRANHLIDPSSGTPPEPPAPPDNPTSKWYRVTASALNVRQGPGTSYAILGTLRQNEVVEGIATSADGTWIQIHQVNGLSGWCHGSFLELTNLTTQPPPPPTTSPLTWYQVNATTLNVREGPGTSYPQSGYVKQGDILSSTESTADKAWVKIRRFDGLTGWCGTNYLINLGNTPPSSITYGLSNGVTYHRKEILSPRRMVAHILVIDAKLEGIQFLVTPSSRTDGIICSRKTSQFLKEFGMQVAVNGDGFDYLNPASYDPQTICPNGGEPVKVFSYAASRGKVYAPKLPERPVLYINQNNEITFNTPKGNIYNAISGDRMLIDKGLVVSTLESQTVEPRTAIGLNQNGRWLILAVVDGRQAGYSEGATFPELANLLLPFGAYTAINMDGGGSSALVIEGALGATVLMNSPIEGNLPGNECAVANHLGIKIK